MKKRLISLFLLLLSVAVFTVSAFAYNTGDDYPQNLKSAAQDAVIDPWKYYNRECTSFVAWCLNSRNGVAFHNWFGGVNWGNASSWDDAARACGYAVDGNPQIGAIAQTDAGGYGHVAWVRAVNGNSVTIEEYNYNYSGTYHERTVNKSAFCYIHVKDLQPPAPTKVSQRYQASDYNEGWYEGEWSNGKPNGNGKLTYDDFDDGKYYTLDTDGTSYKALSYEGGFADGYRNGHGVVIFEGGYREEGTYYGQWSAGKTVFEGKRWKTTSDSEGYWPLTTVASSTVAATDYLGNWVYTKEPKPKTIPAESITLSKTSLSLFLKDNATLTATVSPSNATDKTVMWQSSDESVATVNNGKVTAVSVGSAALKATCGKASAVCKVTVTEKTVEVQSVTLDQLSLEMTKGEKATLIASVFPDNATDSTVSWNSSNESVATVRNGKVTALAEGFATIKATCGGKSASCTVVVSEEATSDVVFPRRNVYHQGQFSDVPANQWYTDSVANAFAFGLMTGTSAATFDPYGEVTVAEAITMAARMHSIYTTGTENFDQSSGSAWYQCYLDYAYENGIIGYDYYNSDVTFAATRSEYAEIFANALPEEALAPINRILDGAIPDVNGKAWYAPSVYKLYRAGILTGGDANGTFAPDTYITRAESAAIVSRVASSDLRVSFSLGK